MSKINLSIVIPVFNSEACIRALADRIQEALSSFVGSYEVLLIDDSSEDDSWMIIDELCHEVKEFCGYRFQRNLGQDNAIMTGLTHAVGEIIIIMDDDLQHDPEHISLLVDALGQHYDVCYANFVVKRQAKYKNLGSWLNNLVANVVLRKPRALYLSPFKAIRKEIIREVIKYQGPYPYIDGLILGITSNVTQIALDHKPRYSGKGNYDLRASVRVWLRVLTNFSVAPLRLVTVFGFLVSSSGFILMMVYLAQWQFGVRGPTGWLTVIVSVLLLGGVQLISLGLIGEYVGRIFVSQNHVNQYVIESEGNQ